MPCGALIFGLGADWASWACAAFKLVSRALGLSAVSQQKAREDGADAWLKPKGKRLQLVHLLLNVSRKPHNKLDGWPFEGPVK